MVQPALDFWRGERVSFPAARVFRLKDLDLAPALRVRAAQVGNQPTAIDLFCGAGGLSLGLDHAGFCPILGVDSDKASCETYAHHFNTVAVAADLNDTEPLLRIIAEAGVHQVDLLAGAPPCQPFSRAAKSKIRSLRTQGQSPEDERPKLWLPFLRFVQALMPTSVLLENVPDLVLWDHGQTLREICWSLENLGYEVQVRVLDCWRYGVPQHRQRLFVVGTLVPHSFKWPAGVDEVVTLGDAIGDLPTVGPAQREYLIGYAAAPETPFQKVMRKGAPDRVADHITRDVRADDLKAFRLLREGRRYANLPKKLRRYRSDIFDDKYNILNWEGLSRSITAHIAKDGYWYIHPDGKRTLSIREAARLQTFPDSFSFAGFPSDRLRQIGNAVPPVVAIRLGQSILSGMVEHDANGVALPFKATTFRRKLLAWYRKEARQYPWREERDPWLILAAEILLRRTRADTVARLWPDLRRQFSSPREVAERPAAVRKLLRPLGLRWRVENLINVARRLIAHWNGQVPTARKDLMDLPGVGDYVADAVRAFAFDERAVLVDSNTARIAARVFGLPTKWSSLRNLNLRGGVARLGGARPPTPDVNLALLDLAGTICLPGRPRCEDCPVRELCLFGQTEESSSPVLHLP